VAAFGLIQARYPDVAIHLVDLLADPERAARMAAARALAYWGRPEAALLLRLALLHGDPEAEVMGECFNALLKLREAEAVPFVAEFLSATRRPSVRPQGVRRLEVEVAADPAVAEAAAMALGQSRCAEAIAPLKHAWEHTLEPSLRQVLLVSLALLRQPAATEFLVTLIAGGGRRPACDAVAALGPFLYDPALREQVARAVEVRGDPEVRRALREAIDRTEG
jgi:HEAT repeat protein